MNIKISDLARLLILGTLLLPLYTALAQSDGSVPALEATTSSATPTAIETPPTKVPEASSVPEPQVTLPGEVTPRELPVPSVSSTPSTSPGAANPTPEIIETSAPTESPIPAQSSETNPLLWAGLVAAFVLGVFGAMKALWNKNKQEKNNADQDSSRCDSIKQLLEQKKKELEEKIKKWPEEKIKELAKDKILKEAKKDADAKIVLDAAENIKNEYDGLVETIELLKTRYDLCMLSLPQKGGAHYVGRIIENSLKDAEVLENLKMLKKYEKNDWKLREVLVSEKQIEKLGEGLRDGPWYMCFWEENKDEMLIIFKNKKLKIKRSDKTTWSEAIEYGKSKGLQEAQLNFAIQEEKITD